LTPGEQRIARLGQEVYQTLMRLSLREPSSRADVTLVVVDKDVAEWLPQWFEPRDQVEVAEIDSTVASFAAKASPVGRELATKR
jgi:hypothetical protein